MLSVIITALNEDNIIINRTIKSIVDSTPQEDVEIIVIDDCSDSPIIIDKYLKNRIKLERNIYNLRMGVANSRHVGATLATKKWLLFTDAHMVFHPDWYNNFLQYQRASEETTVYNGTCLGLWGNDQIDYQNLNLDKLPHYYGAKLSLWEEKDKQILEGKWISEKKDEDNYDISCLMGAIYFIQRQFFFKIRGLSDLKMWGSDEPCLSLKTLLCGGKIKQLKNVRSAHLFRQVAPYITNPKYLIYNKIRMAKTLLPCDISEALIHKLDKDQYFKEANDMIIRENNIIQEYKKYYNSIFINENQVIKNLSL